MALRDFHSIGATRHHEARDTLLREGFPADHPLIICSGRVKADTSLPLSFLMQLTHEDLGSMAGLSRETVSRLLARFRRDGHVLQIHDRMTLNHPIQMEARYC